MPLGATNVEHRIKGGEQTMPNPESRRLIADLSSQLQEMVVRLERVPPPATRGHQLQRLHVIWEQTSQNLASLVETGMDVSIDQAALRQIEARVRAITRAVETPRTYSLALDRAVSILERIDTSCHVLRGGGSRDFP